MKLPAIFVADLHLTSNIRDEYRWGLWPWLRNQIVLERARTLCILGDLSDAKDFHPSSLVNRIATEVRLTAEVQPLERINMIPGNHEWLKEGEEFWRFLNHVHPKVRYMVRPTEDDEMTRAAYFLPFTRNPARDWKGMDFQEYDYVFMHQTIRGAKASNGGEMDGEDLPDLSSARKIYSGDIHVPQEVGPIEYVGSPYHVHFGDAFRPRCVLLENNGATVDLRFETISRVTIDASGLADLNRQAGTLRPGDQVKVRMSLDEADKHEWRALRRKAYETLREAGAEVHGLELVLTKVQGRRKLEAAPSGSPARSPEDQLLRFVESEELGPEALGAAMEVLGK